MQAYIIVAIKKAITYVHFKIFQTSIGRVNNLVAVRKSHNGFMIQSQERNLFKKIIFCDHYWVQSLRQTPYINVKFLRPREVKCSTSERSEVRISTVVSRSSQMRIEHDATIDINKKICYHAILEFENPQYISYRSLDYISFCVISLHLNSCYKEFSPYVVLIISHVLHEYFFFSAYKLFIRRPKYLLYLILYSHSLLHIYGQVNLSFTNLYNIMLYAVVEKITTKNIFIVF